MLDQLLVVGAGQLGSALKVVGGQWASEGRLGSLQVLDRSRLDVCDAAAVQRVVGDLRPSVLVNAAAFTQVDTAEVDPERAFGVNAVAPVWLARAAASVGAQFVQVSTDYVFSGDLGRPYVEEDVPGPLGIYGASKLAGEYAALAYAPGAMVVRTSGLFGSGGANFVQAVIRQARGGGALRVVDDQVVGPTFASDLADMLLVLVEQRITGVVHVSGTGECSWWEFARAIVEALGLENAAPVEPVHSEAWAARRAPQITARRPRYAVLAHKRLAGMGLAMPHWRAGLARYLATDGPITDE